MPLFLHFLSLFSLFFSPSNSLSLTSHSLSQKPSLSSSSASAKLPFKYSNALVVSLPMGTPPQPMDMVLDTGSQLSWTQCRGEVNGKLVKPGITMFDPSRSSSFSLLPCNTSLCIPQIPDFTLPTSCDQRRLCHYSYFYADGTLAEGNLVTEKFTFSNSLITPSIILGCAKASTENRGILGMNTGRLSFISQAKISKFSYCIPGRSGSDPTGLFYLGDNPNSGKFKYVNMLTFPQSQRAPNLDKLAYTLPMKGIRIAKNQLNISPTVFKPDPSGSGQTMIDSGSDLTYLVDEAYNKVRAEIVRLVGPMMKKGYEYASVADMCFDGAVAAAAGQGIGDMWFEFENGVEILVGKGEGLLTEVEKGVKCIGIGRSDRLGTGSNIIGNVHQQNMWVEYDFTNKRVGFGGAECSGLKA
ncbi:aspartic proteinase PCS1-like [Cucurbita pepo subsp. pepo]|uniref:aspartic proteinase PCS1-like n=1 Tax=Cucurbita pepo subsp. pepo TaxID=3664 RepID=UPI000C9D2C38|nr:aspartic proteinase PCS1-like [Cucurbita pepo subsp. pepo]